MSVPYDAVPSQKVAMQERLARGAAARYA